MENNKDSSKNDWLIKNFESKNFNIKAINSNAYNNWIKKNLFKYSKKTFQYLNNNEILTLYTIYSKNQRFYIVYC